MSAIENYRQSIIPPYTARDLVPLLATLFFLLSIFLTLLLLKERKDNRGHAAELNTIEAEEIIITGPISIQSDSQASHGKYILFAGQAGQMTTEISQCSVPLIYGVGTITVDIEKAANYSIWSRLMSVGKVADSFYIQIDDRCPILVGDSSMLVAGEWQWINYNTTIQNKVMANLSAGRHIVKIIGREPGVKLDRLQFIQDSTCIPKNVSGLNCTVTQK